MSKFNFPAFPTWKTYLPIWNTYPYNQKTLNIIANNSTTNNNKKKAQIIRQNLVKHKAYDTITNNSITNCNKKKTQVINQNLLNFAKKLKFTINKPIKSYNDAINFIMKCKNHIICLK